ncbi:hypothetical protein MRB53_038495 [Persea americana]|nr:hypothetical protein MRB53_038495 [Persea americana]
MHPSVKREKAGSVVDARCRSLTAGFVKEKKERGEDVELCIYHDNLDLLEPHNLIPPGVWTLDGMLKYGRAAKAMSLFHRPTDDAILQSHNIDNVCIESLSIDITDESLRKAKRGANNLDRKITELKETDADKLQNEYNKLVEGLRGADEARDEDAFMANPGTISPLEMYPKMLGFNTVVQESYSMTLARTIVLAHDRDERRRSVRRLLRLPNQK